MDNLLTVLFIYLLLRLIDLGTSVREYHNKQWSDESK